MVCQSQTLVFQAIHRTLEPFAQPTPLARQWSRCIRQQFNIDYLHLSTQPLCPARTHVLHRACLCPQEIPSVLLLLSSNSPSRTRRKQRPPCSCTRRATSCTIACC